MMHDKALVTEKLRKWERFLQEYALPTWDMLPGIDLYMDQAGKSIWKGNRICSRIDFCTVHLSAHAGLWKRCRISGTGPEQ